MNRLIGIVISLIFPCIISFSQTVINIDANVDRKLISPYIYGKNNCLSDDPEEPLEESQWKYYRDAGLKFVRENSGNNATKYNWRLKLSSHPDWYNNVYSHDWDYEAQSLADNMPGVRGMWALQLIGKVASNRNHNFNDWDYNQSQSWSGTHQNLAGGGVINEGGGDYALSDGNPDLYLTDWPADSAVGILNHWFSTDGLNLNKNDFCYWNMDNEPEIWEGTHDDIMPVQPSAEEFMQMYFSVVKKAREVFPEIKITGPVTCNEWQWYNWSNHLISYHGRNYSWLEYFILRVAEEQVATGIKLLDVLDIHFYPGTTDAETIVQLYRVFFDRDYDYPGANGVRSITGILDNDTNKEYVLARCSDWLNQYIGPNHNVSLGISEMGIQGDNPNVSAVSYASTLGIFADKGVEYFAPWFWKTGMWETLHLFSRYAKQVRVHSTSSNEEFVSAYTSLSTDNDSITIMLINRSVNQSDNVTVNLSNVTMSDGNYNILQLKDLPDDETFVSHESNALDYGSVIVSANSFNINLPPLTVTAVLLPASTMHMDPVEFTEVRDNSFSLRYFGNGILNISYSLINEEEISIDLFDIYGKKISNIEQLTRSDGNYTIRYDISNLPYGMYLVSFRTGNYIKTEKIIHRKSN